MIKIKKIKYRFTFCNKLPFFVKKGGVTMGNLYDLIKNYTSGSNQELILDIIEKFDPLLNKYQRLSSNEDMKSELTVFLFKLLRNIPLSKDIFKEDKYLTSYICKSLKNQYIYLNKAICKVKDKEIELDENIINLSSSDFFDDLFFYEMISNLTNLEKDILKKKYIFNYSESEIAILNNVTRQAIHKTHKRALNKLRKEYISLSLS